VPRREQMGWLPVTFGSTGVVRQDALPRSQKAGRPLRGPARSRDFDERHTRGRRRLPRNGEGPGVGMAPNKGAVRDVSSGFSYELSPEAQAKKNRLPGLPS